MKKLKLLINIVTAVCIAAILVCFLNTKKVKADNVSFQIKEFGVQYSSEVKTKEIGLTFIDFTDVPSTVNAKITEAATGTEKVSLSNLSVTDDKITIDFTGYDIGSYILSVEAIDSTTISYSASKNFCVGYTVTYLSSGATGGNAPVDNKAYVANGLVNIKSASSLQRQGFRVNGWKDQDGNKYSTGYQKINSDLVLTPIWEPAVVATPSDENDYTININTSETLTYKWYRIDNTNEINPFIDQVTFDNYIYPDGYGSSFNLNQNVIEGVTSEGITKVELKLKNVKQYDVISFKANAEIETFNDIYKLGDTYYLTINSVNDVIEISTSANALKLSDLKIIETTSVETSYTTNALPAQESGHYYCMITFADTCIYSKTCYANVCTVIYDVRSGAQGDIPASYKAFEGRPYTILGSSLSRPGFEFKGWMLNDSLYQAGDEVVLTDDVTFEAFWSLVLDEQPSKNNGYQALTSATIDIDYQWYEIVPNEYSVTFDNDNKKATSDGKLLFTYEGSYNDSLLKSVYYSQTKGQYIELVIPDYQKCNIKFKSSFTGILTKNATVTYKDEIYTITPTSENVILYKNAFFSIGDISVVLKDAAALELQTSNTLVPDHAGNYYCELTYDNGTKLLSDEIKVSFYSLVYDKNGATGQDMTSETVIEDSILIVKECNFTKVGEQFIEWNTRNSGLGDSYNPNDEIKLTSDITLYAIFKAYDSISLAPSETVFRYTGSPLTYDLPESNAYTITGQTQTEVGIYTVVVSLNDKVMTRWDDGTVLDKTFTFEILKGIYDLSDCFKDKKVAYTGTYITNEATNLPDGVSAFYKYYLGSTLLVNAPKESGSYQVVGNFTGDTVHYEAIAPITVNLVIEKLKVEIPTALDTVYIYNGEEQIYDIVDNDLIFNVTGNKQTNAGTYTVTVSLLDKYNSSWSDNTILDLTFDFTINKKVYDISEAYMDDLTVLYDGQIHTLVVQNLPEGLVPVFENNDQSLPGSYDVIAKFDLDLDNYEEVASISAKLTILATTFTSDDGEKPLVKVTSLNGFESGVFFEFTSRSSNKSSLIDYKKDLGEYNLKDEKISKIYSLSLYKLDSNGNKVPYELTENVIVEFYIPSSINVDDITRIMHVHSKNNIEAFKFDEANYKNGYYTLVIDSFSDIVIVTSDSMFFYWWILLLVVGVIVIGYTLLYITKAKYSKLIPLSLGLMIAAVAISVALALIASTKLCYIFALANGVVVLLFFILLIFGKKRNLKDDIKAKMQKKVIRKPIEGKDMD